MILPVQASLDGNTVEMADGHLLSVFSYKKSVPQDFRPTFIQAVRWRLPPQTQTGGAKHAMQGLPDIRPVC